MPTQALLHVLELRSDAKCAALFEDLLADADPLFVSWQDEDTGAVRFERYCRTPAEAKRVRVRIEGLLRGAGLARGSGRIRMRIRAMPARDWAEAWKEFFHVQRVSPRVVVKPSWESYDPQPGDCVVQIDPGMSFGTGQHATTRACLVLLDEAALDPGMKSFLDLGCGSGILSIAAAGLGFGKVVAVDNDPIAVECARAGASGNGVAESVKCVEADISAWRPGRTFDLVAANILAPVLIDNAAGIAAMVSGRPGGRLIIAGILNGQYRNVLGAYKTEGFKETRRITEGEWTSGLLVRAPRPSGCRRSRPTTSASKRRAGRLPWRSSGCPVP